MHCPEHPVCTQTIQSYTYKRKGDLSSATRAGLEAAGFSVELNIAMRPYTYGTAKGDYPPSSYTISRTFDPPAPATEVAALCTAAGVPEPGHMNYTVVTDPAGTRHTCCQVVSAPMPLYHDGGPFTPGTVPCPGAEVLQPA